MNTTTVDYEDPFDIQGVNLSGEFFPYCNVCDPSGEPSPSYKIYNMIMTGILLPTIGLFGVVGNTISAYVYTRKRMLSSMNVYLCALAVSDIWVITTAFFLFFMEGMRRYNHHIAYMFGAGAPVFFPAGLAAQTCSVYFTVAAAIDCFLLVIVLIVVLSMGYNAAHCFEVSVIKCFDPKFDAISLQVCMTEFRMNELYLEIYYAWLYTIVMAAGPLIVLVLLNACIIVALAMAKRRKSETHRHPPPLPLPHSNGHAPLLHTGGSHMEEDAGSEEEEVDAITLILVVFLFIFCNSLALIINFLEQTYYDQLGEALNYLVDVSNLFVVCNSSANILFYYFFGDAFRATLQDLWRHRGSKYRLCPDKRAPLSPIPNGDVPSPDELHLRRSPRSPDETSLSASIPLYLETLDPQHVRVHTHQI